MIAYLKFLFIVGGAMSLVGITGAIVVGFISAIFRTRKQEKIE